jgi:DNA-binding SARP family transcriptional activator/DNA-binding beta-propeller fold protein YncE
MEAEPQNRLKARFKIGSTTKAGAQASTEAATPRSSTLDIRVLGPLVAARNGEPLSLGGNRQRALLALFSLNCGAVLSVDRIVDELWGESPPPTARHMVEVYVSKLRRILGAELIRTQAPGYVLDVAPESLDANRFETLLKEGAEALGRDEAEFATSLLREALGLWRGEALAEFSYERFAQAEISRLNELRHRAEEELIEAELALGRTHELIARIERLVAEEPLRERRHGQLMRAFYRAARQADALAAYRRAHGILVKELGIKPGPELQRLERAILNQEESVLAATARPQPLRHHDRGRRPGGLVLLVTLSCTAAVIAAVTTWLATAGDDASPSRPPAAPSHVRPNSVAVINPITAKVIRDVPVGRTPGPIDVGGGSLWVGNYEDRTVSRIGLKTLEVDTVGIPVRPYGLAYGNGAVWVTQQGGEGTAGSVSRLDLLSHRADVISVGRGDPLGEDDVPRGAPTLVSRSMPVVVHEGSVWLGRRSSSPQVVKVDGSSQKILSRIDGPDPADLGAQADSIWVVDAFENAVLRIDEHSGRVIGRVTVGEAPCCIAATSEAIWVVSGRTQVWVVSPRTNSVEATIDVGEIPVAIDADDGAAWVANYGDSSVSRIDAHSYQVTTIKLDRRPVDIAVGGGRVWVSIDQ